MVETRSQLHEFRNENGASLRRITPSTQVGRLSGSHSDIGFRLYNSIPRWKKVREPQGEKVSATELFNNLFTHLQNAAERRRLKAAVGNLFVGKVS